MREELIHDALNLLDDDLIGEVEWLRSRKKRKNVTWISWAATAACLGFALINLFSMMGGSSSDSAAEAGITIQDQEESTEANGGLQADSDSSVIAENEKVDDTVGNLEAKEVPSVLVEITAWEEDGFVGTIVGIVDTDIYRVGTAVFVSTGEMSELQDSKVIENTYPEGSIVRVQFNERQEEDRIILYAESIELSEIE